MDTFYIFLFPHRRRWNSQADVCEHVTDEWYSTFACCPETRQSDKSEL